MVEKSTSGILAIVGLGKIGGNLAQQALEKGFDVAGYTLGGAPSELIEAGLVPVAALENLAAVLPQPRRVFLYIPAGPAVDDTLDRLVSILDEDDIVVDSGNSYWGDSIRRHRRAAEHGISQSVMQLLASRDKPRIWARAIAAMRHGFGGHPFGHDDAIRRGRATSRIGPFWRAPDSSR